MNTLILIIICLIYAAPYIIGGALALALLRLLWRWGSDE